MTVKETHTVSIIVPVYEVESYIRDCMESLIHQTLDCLQIICIDNGCEDESANIVRQYAQKYRQIEIITLKKNVGMPRARNIGIEAAKGEYIAFVDSDDMCAATMYEKLYIAAKTHNAEIATCNVAVFTESFADAKDHHPEAWYSETARPYTITGHPEQIMEQAAWAKVVKREYASRVGYQFTEGSSFCEDVPGATTIFFHAKRIISLNETLYYYRDRPGSLSKKMNKKYADDFVWAMTRQDDILKGLNITDELTLYYILKMRILIANHILLKMNSSDLKYCINKIGEAFLFFDDDTLKKGYNAYPFLKGLVDSIRGKSYTKYKLWAGMYA